ncbi:MAG: flagellar biosynthesis protein FlhA [Deltaproteobacteria bacterium]|nr:flagellar biosynthesis protein FlhA [Deltaproteobacteria bacterium]
MAALDIPTKSSKGEYALPILLVSALLMMIMPIPAFIIDFFLTMSIGFSLMIFMASVYSYRPMELSLFPTLLLISTLVRLSVNVATTRAILLKGGEGPDAAGSVIRTFGEFVVGGNYVVGIIIFLVLVIINFIVITKGSGRVAEVGARFMLDSMPGKQMAIDADLSAGLITEQEAIRRRRDIQEEADFYGSMDGASKFVRGDAMAGLLITGINIVGGFIIGIAQFEMSAAESGATYTILTVGDGLVSQIPALLISTAAGIVVTRSSSGKQLGSEMAKQVFSHKRALNISGVVLGSLALVPGLPVIPFVALGGFMLYYARKPREVEPEEAQTSVRADEPVSEGERLAALLPLDMLEIEVGYELVPLVDISQGGELTDRIGGLRRNLVTEMGIILPPIHVRDNLQLAPQEYRFMLSGTEIGRSNVRASRLLAIDPGGGAPAIGGERTTEPAFGLTAWWIPKADRAKAENLGYTVVDPATVMVTHITELVKANAHELLGRAEAQDLFDILARNHPRLVEELIPAVLSATDVIRVLRNLLAEGISIRDLRSIFEVLAEFGQHVKDTTELTEYVRARLARTITEKFISENRKVQGLVLDGGIENELRQSSAGKPLHAVGVDPRIGRRLLEHVEKLAVEFSRSTAPPVLVTSPDVRKGISDFIKPRVPGLSVISYAEVTTGTEIVPLGVVGLPDGQINR